MSQQLAIIVMVDIEAAIQANTLEGNTYLFDNMKLQGSEGQGTGNLVTAINGTHWCDGSQANEQVLNWLPYGIGSLPPTLPKTFHFDQSESGDLQVLKDLEELANRIETTEKEKFTTVQNVLEELKSINQNKGINTKVKSKSRDAQHDVGIKVLDVTGELVSQDDEGKLPEISHLTPRIIDITGEAVDKKIIYPAQYGSPDLATDGWYWSATIDTSNAGTYAYTMEFELYKLSFVKEEWTWRPVKMTYQSRLKITNDPKRNGFTNGGVGILPIM